MPGYFLDHRQIPYITGNYKWVSPTNFFTEETRLADRNSGRAAVWSYRSNRDHAVDANYRKNLLRDSKIDAYRTKHDNGHAFWSEKSFHKTTHPYVELRSSGNARYFGPLIVQIPGVTPAVFLPSQTDVNHFGADNYRFKNQLSASQLEALGTRAMLQTMPTRPSASLAQILGELTEGLPKVLLSGMLNNRKKLSSAGGEYLNVEFGWKPLISDLQKIAKAVGDANRIIEQYRRDSGLSVHREYSFQPVQTLHREIVGPVEPAANSRYLAPNPSVSFFWDNSYWQTGSAVRRTVVQTETRKTWFSGSWTYLLEEGSSFLESMTRFEQEANRLLGTRITPELLWELAPWSWMVDWFANIGTLVSVNSQLQHDNLVLRYGYLMNETIQKTVVTTAFARYNSSVLRVGTVYTYQRKDRVRATPYGFGLKTEEFTPQQWAILAALGLTKGGRALP